MSKAFLKQVFEAAGLVRAIIVGLALLASYAFLFGQRDANKTNEITTLKAEVATLRADLDKHEITGSQAVEKLDTNNTSAHTTMMSTLNKIAIDVAGMKADLEWLKKQDKTAMLDNHSR